MNKKTICFALVVMLLTVTFSPISLGAGSVAWLYINFDHGTGANVWQTSNGLFVSDATPVILNGRAYLPVRFIAESFGLAADYSIASDGSTTRVVFYEPDANFWIWPLNGGSNPQADDLFGTPRDHPGGHAGLDIDAPEGTEIYASKSGTVELAEWVEGYGWLMILQHQDGTTSYYGHMRYENPYAVEVGDVVEQGQIIGYSGNTGWSTAPHLHFEIHDTSDNPIDPLPLLRP